MSRLSSETAAGSVDTAAEEANDSTALSSDDSVAEDSRDTAREALVEAFAAHLGDALLDHHIDPGVDVWLRVANEAWRETARFAQDGLGFAYFGFLSAIDWLPSPYGRDMNAQIDLQLGNDTAAEIDRSIVAGVAGGETRFQVFCRLNDIVHHSAVTIKADIGDDLTVDSLISVYPGADWHERECHEMYGVSFAGHPDLRPIYLPTEFEGHPLRKDYPLLARRMKPWPGIVDVELMPEPEPSGNGPAHEDAAADDAQAVHSDGSDPESEADNPGPEDTADETES